MFVDPLVIPGLLLLAGELTALAAVGFIVVRVALRQTDERLAMAQGLVVGLALWGLIANFVIFVIPGLAGAGVAWLGTLAIGAVLVWKSPSSIRPRPRLVAGFGAAALGLFWVALAGRQLLSIGEAAIHFGLSGSIRAGGVHPPELPWNPGLAAPYHYGVDLLIGLLTPPSGPDPAFTTEIVAAYIWTSYALVVVTMLLQRSSWGIVGIVAPLLLAAGTETFLSASPGVLQVPVPAGIPAPGLRASLGLVYVDGFAKTISWNTNIATLNFTLAYALSLVVLQRVSEGSSGRWFTQGALAILVGFLSLFDTVIALVVLAAWGGLELLRVRPVRNRPSVRPIAVGQAVFGPAVAALLVGTAGSVGSGLLVAEGPSGVSLSGIGDTSLRPPVVSLTALPGGLGLLGLGPLVVAVMAVLLARRDRLSVALAVCSGACLLGALTLRYEYAQHDVTRLDGHARNLALLALLLALSPRLANLPARWRYAAGALIVGLVTWPTVIQPARTIGTALSNGVQLANAGHDAAESRSPHSGRRGVFPRLASERVADFVRTRTAIDARILSPQPEAMSATTGRSNASGLTQAAHYIFATGPEYLDAVRHLEPAAITRRGFTHVHATDGWIAKLPDRARRWLNDLEYFEVLVRDGADTLYRIQPAFLEIEATPTPGSYEALRRSVPSSAIVHVEPTTEVGHALQLASALSHARLVGEVDPGQRHLRTDFGIEALGEHRPDFVVAPRWFTPSMFAPRARRPVWWNDWVAIYARDGAPASLMPAATAAPPPISIEVSDGVAKDGRATFTLTLTNRAPDRWTGQDWLVLPASIDGLPELPHLGKSAAQLWFSGQIAPGHENTRLTYVFDPWSASLSVRAGDGSLSAAGGGGDALGPGRWTLVLRLNRDVRRQDYVGQEAAAYVPVMHMDISASGEVSYTVYEGDLNARLKS